MSALKLTAGMTQPLELESLSPTLCSLSTPTSLFNTLAYFLGSDTETVILAGTHMMRSACHYLFYFLNSDHKLGVEKREGVGGLGVACARNLLKPGGGFF